MSCTMCCFTFCNVCGCRDTILRITAFHPPKPNYEIVACPNKPGSFQMELFDNNGTKFIPKDLDGITSNVFWLQTKNQNRIPAIYFENTKSNNHTVILYSHGNSTDLGRMRNYLQDISFTLNVNVFAYEYTGYGASTGKPSDINLLHDVEAAYIYLLEKLNYPWFNIILYGRSIGSGPSIYLASNPYYRVGGLILHSPIASGARILKFGINQTPDYDMFPNCDMIVYVKCHVYLFHGENDTEVPIAHGKLLASKIKNLYEAWWVEGGTHNDIDSKFRKNYFINISKFLKHLKEFREKQTPKSIDGFYKVENWIKNSNHIYFKRKDRQAAYAMHGATAKFIDSSSFASNISFLGSQNNTTLSKPEKNNTDSVLTVGAETNRKNPIETTRSACEYNEDKKEAAHKNPPVVEIEASYSARLANPTQKQTTEEITTKKTLATGNQEDVLNTAQIEPISPQNESPLNEMDIKMNVMSNPNKTTSSTLIKKAEGQEPAS